MGNAITGKQYQDYKNSLFHVRVYSKEDKFHLVDYTSHVGLIEAYEFSQPYMLAGEHVLIIPHEVFHESYMVDGTIRTCFDMNRMLAELAIIRRKQGFKKFITESEKAEYLLIRGYVFMDAYTLKEHKINNKITA